MPTQVCHDERVTTHTNPAGSTPAPTISYADGSFEEIILVVPSRIVVTDAFVQQDGSALVTLDGEFRHVKFRTGDDGVDGYGRRIADLIPERVNVRRPVDEFYNSFEYGYRGSSGNQPHHHAPNGYDG